MAAGIGIGAAAILLLALYLPRAVRMHAVRRETLAIALLGSISLFLAAARLLFPENGFVCALTVLWYIGFAVFLLTELWIVSGGREREEYAVEWLLVLGYHTENGVLPPEGAARVKRAAEYLRKYPETRAVLTGGGSGTLSEAAVMMRALCEHGIAPERVFLEEKSSITAENLRFSRELTGECGAVGLVTSGFHLRRAVLLAKKAGYERVLPLPAEKTPGDAALYHYVREFMSIISDKLDHYW